MCIVCERVCTHMRWCSWWNMYMLAYTKELGLDYVNKFLTACFQRHCNLRVQLLRWVNYSLVVLPGRRGMRTFLFPGGVWGMGEQKVDESIKCQHTLAGSERKIRMSRYMSLHFH